MTDVTSRALLLLEFSSLTPAHCYLCGGTKPCHEPMCLMNEALAERGFNSAADRDAARERIKYATAPTDPPILELDELE